MYLLISFRRVASPGCAVLSLLDDATGRIRPILKRPDEPSGCDGLTGLALSDDALFVAASPFRHRGEVEPSVLVFRPSDLMPMGRYRLEGLADVGSIWYRDGTLYVASTGTGEVVGFKTIGPRIEPDRFVWRPRLDGENKRSLRLSSLCVFRNELLATAIDPDPSADPATRGLLLNITRDSVAARNLADPTSMAVLGDALGYCAGEPGEVRLLDDPEGRVASLGGHAQGLCAQDDRVFTASRSPDGQRLLHELSIDDLTIRDSVPLDVSSGEVFQLFPIEGAGAWPSPLEPHWHQIYGQPL